MIVKVCLGEWCRGIVSYSTPTQKITMYSIRVKTFKTLNITWYHFIVRCHARYTHRSSAWQPSACTRFDVSIRRVIGFDSEKKP